MSGTDDLRAAREALVRYRESSLCGSCKEDAEVMIDAIDKSLQFEGLMRQYVATGMEHPRAAHLDERRRQIGAARDEVARRLGAGAPDRPTVLQHRPGEAVDAVRSWGDGLRAVVPRPLAFLRPARRRET